jgi:hypothetical protein
MDDIDKMTEASILLDPYNTKRIIQDLTSEFSEDTIYRAFIIYCRFNSILPVSENMRSICLEKPDTVSIDDSINEIIRKLKRDGRHYNKETLDMLMKIINYKNVVKLHLDHVEFSPIFYLRNITENKENTFQELLYNVLDTYDVAMIEDNKETRAFKNFIGKENGIMLEQIKRFIKSHSKLNKSDYTDLVNTITTITEFSLIENDTFNNSENATTYVYVEFIKNSIRNLIDVYPDIILNKVDYDDINIPRHWKISHRHTLDLQTFIKKYYEPLKQFYNNKHIQLILNVIHSKTLYIYNLAKHTPFFSPILRDNKDIYSNGNSFRSDSEFFGRKFRSIANDRDIKHSLDQFKDMISNGEIQDVIDGYKNGINHVFAILIEKNRLDMADVLKRAGYKITDKNAVMSWIKYSTNDDLKYEVEKYL